MGARTEEPIIGGWRAICFVIAIPIVYFIGNDVYAAVGILSNLSAQGFMTSTMSIVRSFAPPTQGAPSLGAILFGLLVAVPVCLIILVVGLVILLPLVLVFYVVQWLITSTGGVIPGVFHLALDAGLVFLFGAFLYGEVFPLAWLVVEPLLAHTLGEIAFQRVRHRIYGEHPRFAQPIYLLVTILSFGAGGTRFFSPRGPAWGRGVARRSERGLLSPHPDAEPVAEAFCCHAQAGSSDRHSLYG